MHAALSTVFETKRCDARGDVLGCMLVLLLAGLGQIVQQARDNGALTRLALRMKVEECARNGNGMWIIDGVQLHCHLSCYFVHYKGKLRSGMAPFKSTDL